MPDKKRMTAEQKQEILEKWIDALPEIVHWRDFKEMITLFECAVIASLEEKAARQ